MLAEILVASVSAWWAGSAAMTGSTVAGGLLIISASVLAIFARSPRPQPAH
jgi:hypothetical protein